MGRISSTIRITIGLVSLAVTILLGGYSIGLVPDREAAVTAGRQDLCEALAIQCSALASQHNTRLIRTVLKATCQRNRDMLFASVYCRDGTVLAVDGDDAARLHNNTTHDATECRMTVPILEGSQTWGSLEVVFRPLVGSGLRGILRRDIVRLTLAVAAASFISFFVYLRRLLQDLDPSRVIPQRVRDTLDTFAEGLLVLDSDERIVLANRSFAKTVGRAANDLQGHHASNLPWVSPEGQTKNQSKKTKSYPWQQAIDQGETQIGKILDLCLPGSERRTFLVNASPVLSDEGDTQGALASFDDVTAMERNREELCRTLETLKESKEDVHRKNLELEKLASHDPLTSCLNRRAFFSAFETQWSGALRHGYPLSYVMVDIDHFKAVNDQHGHQVGDDVLRKVADVLNSTVRQGDVVCRYGGEEFGILLPHLDLNEAAQAAERYRLAIDATIFPQLHVTASFGVSATGCGATSFQELIQRADKALYAAKHEGRNRVCRWDQVPEDMESQTSVGSTAAPAPSAEVAIPFHAVTALITALSYRDTSTAEHSRRVADLCVATASQSMPVGDVYVLEIAALLHDIGKIGVPDSILLKPGPLTEEEWQVMRVHDRVGTEILKSAFACDRLTAITSNHHAWFGGSPRSRGLPTGANIPIGARLLSIADAFDAITSDRVYRAGRSVEEAFTELRRCAGTQFDPELVEQFIDCVSSRNESRSKQPVNVSKQTALQIGLQIEDLAGAVDRQDQATLVALAERLKLTANKNGVSSIADVAEEFERAARENGEEMQLAELANDLLDLCRATQKAYLGDPILGAVPMMSTVGSP